MKKLIYTIVAALALVACTPDDGVSNKVRIAVSFEEEQQNPKGQQRISAVDKIVEDRHVIDVNWAKDDVLYYEIVGEDINYDNPFKIISGVGTKNAFFENDDLSLSDKMFNLHHGTEIPITQTIEIDNNNQTHIDHTALIYKATNCQIGKSIQFSPQFALLGIQLYGIDNNFDEKVCIGNSNQISSIDALDVYLCGLKESTVVDLNKQPIYYFVLPLNYDFLGKCIWLANTKGHPTTDINNGFLPFASNIELNPNVAQIIRISVQKDNELPGDNARYTISKYNQQ